MANRPAPFKEADVRRAVKGAAAAGFMPDEVVIAPSGEIRLKRRSGPASRERNEWDEAITP